MSDKDSKIHLSSVAKKLQDDPNFMASVLHVYKSTEGLTDENIIDELQTNSDNLIRLSLCKRPIQDSTQFATQVRQLAEFANVNAGKLASLIRQADALNALNQIPKNQSDETKPIFSQAGILAAARDKDDESDDFQEGLDK